MADLEALRDYIKELMRNQPGSEWQPGKLYLEVQKNANRSPIKLPARTTFYKWFSENADSQITSKILDLIPVLATVFNIREHSLYEAAGVLPPEIQASMLLSAAAEDVRNSFENAANALSRIGLSSVGESLVVDRILANKLDYQLGVYPVVNGLSKPLHLRSWIALWPVGSGLRGLRKRTRDLELLNDEEKRARIRESVIGEGLWRSLGLRWRHGRPVDWPWPEPSSLILEVPVLERNRKRSADLSRVQAMTRTQVTVISGSWSRGEQVAAMVAEALGWSYADLRYQGFSDDPAILENQRTTFAVRKVQENAPYVAFAPFSTRSVLEAVRRPILDTASRTILVWIHYGPRFAEHAAVACDTSLDTIDYMQDLAKSIASEVNDIYPIVEIDIVDDDVIPDSSADLDTDQLADVLRYASAQVLNLLCKYYKGPDIAHWGGRFEDLRYGEEDFAVVPFRESKVTLRQPGSICT